MFAGYLQYNGVEIINSSRAAAYSRSLGITDVACDCDGLRYALDDDEYTSVDANSAPWWDPAAPDSKDFAGFVGLGVKGLSKTVASHSVVPLTTGGGALHPLRRAHREIQFQVLALAKTECALSYGFSWLAAALRGSACNPHCGGDQMCFFTCCPSCDEPDPEGNDDCYNNATQYWRSLYNVGLLDMEDPTNVKRVSGGWLAEITFTMAAGNPNIYREPVVVADGPRPDQILPNYEDPGVPPHCLEPVDCLKDPIADCPPPPAPPMPPVPVDRCWPTGPFTAARVIMPIPRDTLAVWLESVPLISINSGSRTLRRVTLRWYENPLGHDCATDLNPCGACAEVNIAYIPRQSTFVLDGRTETVSVDCPGGTGASTAEPAVYGRGGTPFVWPVFSCDSGACLEIIAQANSIADDIYIQVAYVQREDAA